MEFINTQIPDVILIKPNLFKDHRGYVLESFHSEKFKKAGININFLQDNHVKSIKNTLRGLHFQANYPQQMKYFLCLKLFAIHLIQFLSFHHGTLRHLKHPILV